VIDLARHRIYVGGAAGSQEMPIRPGGAALGGYRVTPWGPGPVVAGHATVYHVITYNDEICAEMLVSGWMQPFMAPVVQALICSTTCLRRAAAVHAFHSPCTLLLAGQCWPARSTT
jgi:hypothetical protein